MNTIGRILSNTHRVAVAVLLVVLGLPILVSAQTGCKEWNVGEGWFALQPDDQVEFKLQQRNAMLSGVGSYHATFVNQKYKVSDQPISGTIRGNKIEISTSWGRVYIGTIDKTGQIDGYTYDKLNSASRAKWFSDRRMNCLGSVALKPQSQVCKSGFVHRLASSADRVCVTAQSQARVADENRTAGTRRQPGGGAYGPNTCRAGFVWREAFVGDPVCVTPAIRGLVAEENNLAASRARER